MWNCWSSKIQTVSSQNLWIRSHYTAKPSIYQIIALKASSISISKLNSTDSIRNTTGPTEDKCWTKHCQHLPTTTAPRPTSCQPISSHCEEEAEVIRDTAKTPRHSPWLLDQLPANRLSPIVEEEEEVERDTARAIETQLKHLSVFIGYCET